MAHADQLQSVDINPLLVQQTGAVCLDAVISLQTCP
jgi:succinyl-CoA synthetase beta subunit